MPLSRRLPSIRRWSAWTSRMRVSASTPIRTSPRTSFASHARRSPGRSTGTSVAQRHRAEHLARKRLRSARWPASRSETRQGRRGPTAPSRRLRRAAPVARPRPWSATRLRSGRPRSARSRRHGPVPSGSGRPRGGPRGAHAPSPGGPDGRVGCPGRRGVREVASAHGDCRRFTATHLAIPPGATASRGAGCTPGAQRTRIVTSQSMGLLRRRIATIGDPRMRSRCNPVGARP